MVQELASSFLVWRFRYSDVDLTRDKLNNPHHSGFDLDLHLPQLWYTYLPIITKYQRSNPTIGVAQMRHEERTETVLSGGAKSARAGKA